MPEAGRFVYAGAAYPDQPSGVKAARGGSALGDPLLKVLTGADPASRSLDIRHDLIEAVLKKLRPQGRSGFA